MKFRFCGDGDCPDWVLVEIHSTIAMSSVIKVRNLAKIVAQSIFPKGDDNEIFPETTFSKSAVSCIRFLLLSAAKYNIDEITFSTELQQLGLPKEHSTILGRVLTDELPNIKQQLNENRLRIDVLDDIELLNVNDITECVELNIKIKNEIVNGIPVQSNHHINVHRTDLKVLLHDLKLVRNILENNQKKV